MTARSRGRQPAGARCSPDAAVHEDGPGHPSAYPTAEWKGERERQVVLTVEPAHVEPACACLLFDIRACRFKLVRRVGGDGQIAGEAIFCVPVGELALAALDGIGLAMRSHRRAESVPLSECLVTEMGG